MTLDIGFDCKLARSADALEVTYTIENRTGRDLGVFNRIQGYFPDGGEDFSPDIAYVDLEGDLLGIRKMALPVPPDLQIVAYIAPYASRVPKGGTYTETFHLRIPVRVCHPFKRALLSGQVVADQPASARRAEVMIGVFPCDERSLVSENPAFPDVLTVFDPSAALDGQIALSARFTLDPVVPVLDYRAVPWE